MGKLSARKLAMRDFAAKGDHTYIRRDVETFLVDWVKHPGKKDVIPYLKRDWERLNLQPAASPVFDGWRSVTGYAENIVRWDDRGRRVYVFDYHDLADFAFPLRGCTSHLLERNPTDFTVVSIEEDYNLPGLLVYPEELWDKIAKRTGGIDIDMEWIEFSGRYRIWSNERKFAYGVCHGLAMEFLVAHPGMAVHIEDQVRSFRFPALVRVEELTDRVEEAVAFCDLLPRYLREDGHPSVPR